MRIAGSRWVLLCFALAGCPAKSSPGEARQSDTLPANQSEKETDASVRAVFSPPGAEPVTVRVELAITPEQRERGLMFRKHMEEDAGMLFVFEESEQLRFWMRNTYIPLDMIFIEPSLRVLGIVENAEPMTDTSRWVPGQSQYVVEVNAGFSRRHGLAQGTVVRFDGLPGVGRSE